MLKRFLTWLSQSPQFQKRAARFSHPEITAYYWDGGVPAGKAVKDVSMSGAYLLTTERWYIGTIVTLTLEELSSDDRDSQSVSIPSRIVRHGADGVGLAFMMRAGEDQALKRFLKNVAQGGHESGQALLEFALMVPLMLFLLVNVLNFGGLLYSWITVANAARAGAQYAILSGASLGMPAAPTIAQINNLIATDISSLPNAGSLQVAICTNNNGVISSTPSGGSCPPDPEAPTYVMAAIDVTYTYTPIIQAFNFPGMGMNLSSIFAPSMTVHRRAYMRILQ